MCEKAEKTLNRTEIKMVRRVIRSFCVPACSRRLDGCPSTLWRDKLPNCYELPFKKEFLISAVEKKATKEGITPEDTLRITTFLETLEAMTKTDLAAMEKPDPKSYPTLRELMERRRNQLAEG